MTALFDRLRDRPLVHKAAILFVYGLVTFALIYITGVTVLGNVVFFRVFELLWFVHLLIICNKVQNNQTELLVIALCALSPGIVHNVLGLFAF